MLVKQETLTYTDWNEVFYPFYVVRISLVVRILNSEVLVGEESGGGGGGGGGSKPRADFNADLAFQLFQVDQMIPNILGDFLVKMNCLLVLAKLSPEYWNTDWSWMVVKSLFGITFVSQSLRKSLIAS